MAAVFWAVKLATTGTGEAMSDVIASLPVITVVRRERSGIDRPP